MQKDHIDDVLLDWSKERPDLATDALAIALRLQSLAKSLAGSLTGEFKALDLEWWEYDVLSVLRRKGSPFQMTGEGKSLVDRATTARFENAKDAVEGLSGDEQSELSGLLRKLVLANVRQDV